MTDVLVAAIFCCVFMVWGFACYRIGYWQCHTDNARAQLQHERDRMADEDAHTLQRRTW